LLGSIGVVGYGFFGARCGPRVVGIGTGECALFDSTGVCPFKSESGTNVGGCRRTLFGAGNDSRDGVGEDVITDCSGQRPAGTGAKVGVRMLPDPAGTGAKVGGRMLPGLLAGLKVGVVTGDGKRPAGTGGRVGKITGDGVGPLVGLFVGITGNGVGLSDGGDGIGGSGV